MVFDTQWLLEFCRSEIIAFAADHQRESFYGFAIDGGLLCLNSEERFSETWSTYERQWGEQYRQINKWDDLSRNEQRGAKVLVLEYAQSLGLDHGNEAIRVEVINKIRIRERKQALTQLRENTGDWAYQGFAEMPSPQFDTDAFLQHFSMSDVEQHTSEYASAMDLVLDELGYSNAFGCLMITSDFYCTRVEHNY